jgi:hypothetical protein
MSRLLARILLALFVIPMGILVYLVTFIKCENWFRRWYASGGYQTYYDTLRARYFFTGIVTWAFVGAWWFLLWSKSIKWNALRLGLTAACMAAAAGMGLLLVAILNDGTREFGYFIGSAAAPLLWLVGTVFVWRETAGERAARVDRSGRDAIVCPTCGYNLTGLKESRCPECGTQFTLDQLLASQPARTQGEIGE